VQPGETIYLKEPICTGAVKQGLLEPADLPDCGLYLAIRKFSIQRDGRVFEADLLETVEMLKADALKHMLAGNCIPDSDDRWRPNNRRLAATEKRRAVQLRDTRKVGIYDDVAHAKEPEPMSYEQFVEEKEREGRE
jgi:hypothetical protein